MNRSVIDYTRSEWAADAEHAVRTACYTTQRVTSDPAVWLTGTELAEARDLAAKVVRATRTALTKAGRANERPHLNAHGREAASTYADTGDLACAWARILQIAATVQAAPEQAARLAALAARMTGARDTAAETALQDAIGREVARRNSDEGWTQEQVRRARIYAGPNVTTIRI